ncbi:MAG: hypothetical protein IKU17_05060 [Clostridia bacterium]|nr:hypothetical protein [Clostridia bacterium]
MEKAPIYFGIHIGEHSFDVEHVREELYERVIKPGYNFVTIRPIDRARKLEIPQEYFLDWAQYLAEHKVYFVFLYTVQHALPERESIFEPETVAKMKEIAGEYFLGDLIGEPGSSNACKLQGYFKATATRKGDPNVQKTDAPDMTAAHNHYVEYVSRFINIDKKLDMPNILSVEATALNKYNTEAGVNIPLLELFNGNPDELVPTVRGAAKACRAPMWGTYIAHEWYGGMRHDDILKRKRLELGYKFSYLSGSNVFCLESGDECITAYGHKYGADSVICEEYRAIMDKVWDFAQKDLRPKTGPKVKFAFVYGKDDAWGGWGASAVWNQFLREEWGHNEAEHSWRLLDELGTKRKWSDVANYGEHDLSSAPAYGLYDIVPIEAPVDVLAEYDYLVFLGWNTMTDETMDKLTEYVARGGKLLMSAAHLNRNPQRKGNVIFPAEEKIKKLFGCTFTGVTQRTNGGTKFKYTSLNEDLLPPGTLSFDCDPLYSAGYTEYAKVELCGAQPLGYYADSFGNKPTDLYTVVENKLGSGVATLVTSLNYPGHPALFPLYRTLVREMVTASARTADVQVLASDRLRYAVYEGGKMYLLNTDYDLPIAAKIVCNGKEQNVLLEPLELKTLQI